MATDNINQLLLRNIEQLSASNPLFVNIASDGFYGEYQATHQSAQISCYFTNFAQYTQAKKTTSTTINHHFCAHYQSEVRHDLVVINFPKSKAEFAFTLAMLAQVATDDAMIVIVGENKGGIKSAAKLAKDYFVFCNKIDAARHCLLYVARFRDEIAAFVLEQHFNYYPLEINGQSIQVAALPGVFSQKNLDVGTRVLLNNLPEVISGKVLDFGCGAGVIAAVIAKQNPNVELSLVDVSALALTSAEKTLIDNNLTAKLIASDSLSKVTGEYDFVVSNPPFHQGLKTHYAATENFLMKIKSHLKPEGIITIVANSFLKYPPIMEQCIGKTETICQQNGFSIYQCKLSK